MILQQLLIYEKNYLKRMASLLLTLIAFGAIINEDLTFSKGNVNNKLNKKVLVIDENTNEKLK